MRHPDERNERENAAATVLRSFEKRARRRAKLRATKRSREAYRVAAEQLHAMAQRLAS